MQTIKKEGYFIRIGFSRMNMFPSTRKEAESSMITGIRPVITGLRISMPCAGAVAKMRCLYPSCLCQEMSSCSGKLLTFDYTENESAVGNYCYCA
jgi:hypothetical protein